MTDWEPSSYVLDRAAEKTVEMRTGTGPQWEDVRRRLRELGISPDDAVLAEWQAEGEHVMSGLMGTRDGRWFAFDVIYDYDQSGQPLGHGVGWIGGWQELDTKKLMLTSTGYPNGWAQAAIVARLVFEHEGEG